MSLRLVAVPLVAVIVLSAGCASLYVPYAREVKKKPSEGGTIALRTEHRPEDRARADILMQTNCSGSTVKVVEEGEVVVGEKTDSTARNNAGNESPAFKIGGVSFGQATSDSTNVSSEKTQIKEWHIAYQCLAAVQPEPQPVAKKMRKPKK